MAIVQGAELLNVVVDGGESAKSMDPAGPSTSFHAGECRDGARCDRGSVRRSLLGTVGWARRLKAGQQETTEHTVSAVVRPKMSPLLLIAVSLL
jgi:hypothetical protein